MTYIIAEPCIDIKDLSCVDVCPVDCIHQADRILVIDPEECIDCGACEPECPVEAIFPEDALPDKWQPFVEALFGGAYSTASTQILAAPVVNPLVSINPLIPVGQNVTARLVASRRSFAIVAGGGLDWKVSKHMQIRPFEFDYFQVEPETLIEGPFGRNGSRSNWRYSAGINFTFGAQ